MSRSLFVSVLNSIFCVFCLWTSENEYESLLALTPRMVEKEPLKSVREEGKSLRTLLTVPAIMG